MSFAWLLLRISVFWLAAWGYGKSIREVLKTKWAAGVPSIPAGLVFFLLLSPFLSFLKAFNRSVLPVILAIGAVKGILLLLPVLRRTVRARLRLPGTGDRILLIITSLLVLVNLYVALIPDDNPDSLVTYAVLPDRWLDGGEIVYIEESIFSGFPWVGEISAAWPASLSHGHVDQLVMLQLFQMSMLVFISVSVWKLMGRGLRSLLVCTGACMATRMLVEWASLPKIEMTVLYFTSVAMAALFVQHREADRRFSVVPFLAMGLALGTKVTAYVLVPTFLFMVMFIPAYRRISRLLPGLAILLLTPAIFAVNTYLHTGTPFYPETVPFLPPADDFVRPEVEIIEAHSRANVDPGELLGEKEPDRFFTNLGRLIESWGIPAYLFIVGVFYMAVFRKDYRVLVPFTGMMIYAVIASIVFDPIKWGGKYAFLMTPVLAAGGAEFCRKPLNNRFFLSGLVISLLIIPVTTGVFSRAAEHRFPYRQSESGMIPGVEVQPLHIWCNTNLPEGSRLLSLWKRERYFCEHEIIVIENHPVARRLFLATQLSEEMALLDSMGIDYVYFQSEDPMPGKLERWIRFLDSGRLEKVTEIQGFTLCRVIYKSHRLQEELIKDA